MQMFVEYMTAVLAGTLFACVGRLMLFWKPTAKRR
jgi:hypothetical protein